MLIKRHWSILRGTNHFHRLTLIILFRRVLACKRGTEGLVGISVPLGSFLECVIKSTDLSLEHISTIIALSKYLNFYPFV